MNPRVSVLLRALLLLISAPFVMRVHAAPAGIDLSTPAAAAQAFIDAWKSANIERVRAVMTEKGFKKEFSSHSDEEIKEMFRGVKITGVQRLGDIVRAADGTAKCEVIFLVEENGKVEPDTGMLEETNGEWRVRNI